MRKTIIALTLLLGAAVATPAAAKPRPDVIPLPRGFQPEGITTGKGASFFVGSIPTGDIYGGSLRTGRGDIVVDAPAKRSAIGIKVDRRGRVFVAGGTTTPGNEPGIWVYDTRTGREVAAYPLPDAGFINDVVLTRRAAYFTDSLKPVLYKLPIGRKGALGEEIVTIPITGELTYGPGFNVNGIEAVKGGRTLILVKSSTGELFTSTRKGVTEKIEVSGGDGELINGDGILLKGRTLYVVENRDPNGTAIGEVSAVKLRRNLSEGTIVREITHPRFNVPTTIARGLGRFYVVNAKFGQNTPNQTYEVVRVPKR